jgi:hypothetical protein
VRQVVVNHYSAVSDLLLADFEGLEFDLSNDDFLKRIEEYELKQMVFLLILVMEKIMVITQSNLDFVIVLTVKSL